MSADAEKFWSRVNRDASSGCWEWTGALNAYGYGVLGRIYAHRWSWEINRSPIPTGLSVLHHCDNRKCVRPDHLFIGTQADNIRDAKAKGRLSPPPRSRPRKLTTEDVCNIRSELVTGGRGIGRALAKRYGVSTGMIGHIKKGRKWLEAVRHR